METVPVTEWNSSGAQAETGLQGLGVGSDSYPERPDEAACIYYLRTGFCGYGSRCRFNHPRDRASVVEAMRSAGGDYPERIGQPVCQYYMRTGMCKFGASCKYHHPRHGFGFGFGFGFGLSSTVAVNLSGYPLRPGEKECAYYVKTGQCKFGVTCKFQHPQPTGIIPSQPPPPESLSSIYPSMQSSGVLAGNWPMARPPLLPGSYLPGTYGPVLFPPGMVPFPGWNPQQTPASPVASPSAQPAVGASALYAITPPVPMPSSTGPGSSSRRDAFPERPGEPECQYYLKTGDCKFGPSCKYHHPPDWTVPKTNSMLSPIGLPVHPVSISAHLSLGP